MNQPPGWGPYGPPPQGYPQPPPKKGLSTFASVLLALIVFFIVIPLGSCVACAVCTQMRRDAASGTPSGVPKAIEWKDRPDARAVAAAPVAPEPMTVTVSLATFTKDTMLDECVDFTITSPAWIGEDAGVAFADAFAEDTIGKRKNMSRIYRPCEAQFSGTPALATCTAHITINFTNDAGAYRGTSEIESVGRYYNLDALTQSNEYMKDCFDAKGDWQMVAKDSDAYREAERARARRNIEKSLKIMGQ